MTNCLDPTLKDVLTKRAPYKMYDHCFVQPLVALADSDKLAFEPPRYTAARGDRREIQQEHTYKKKKKKTVRKVHRLPTPSSKFGKSQNSRLEQ